MKIYARAIRVFYASSNFLCVNNELTAREKNYFPPAYGSCFFGFSLLFHDIFYDFVSLQEITMGKTKPTAFLALISSKHQHDYLEALMFGTCCQHGLLLTSLRYINSILNQFHLHSKNPVRSLVVGVHCNCH